MLRQKHLPWVAPAGHQIRRSLAVHTLRLPVSIWTRDKGADVRQERLSRSLVTCITPTASSKADPHSELAFSEYGRAAADAYGVEAVTVALRAGLFPLVKSVCSLTAVAGIWLVEYRFPGLFPLSISVDVVTEPSGIWRVGYAFAGLLPIVARSVDPATEMGACSFACACLWCLGLVWAADAVDTHAPHARALTAIAMIAFLVISGPFFGLELNALNSAFFLRVSGERGACQLHIKFLIVCITFV
jgi:hypothetical protein